MLLLHNKTPFQKLLLHRYNSQAPVKHQLPKNRSARTHAASKNAQKTTSAAHETSPAQKIDLPVTHAASTQ